MILNKITITDFGVYGGINEFDFKTLPEKRVILCGGGNGAGKTTLFESIMLCLYGKNFDDTIDEKKYKEKIMRSFHKNILEKSTSKTASIDIEFEIYDIGQVKKYQISRKWDNNEGKIEEELSIKKAHLEEVEDNNEKNEVFEELDTGLNYENTKSENKKKGEEIDSVDKSQWQSFINQLIPRGIAKIFFFDGEKIQSLADEGNESSYIKSSFDTLLGLDVVNQLSKDLQVFESRKINASDKEKDNLTGILKIREQKLNKLKIELKSDFEALLKFYTVDLEINEFLNEDLEKMLEIREQLIKNISEISTEIQTLTQSKDEHHREFKNLDEHFQKIGGEIYEKQKKIESELNNVNIEIGIKKKEITELISKELQFSLIPNEMDEIKQQVITEQKMLKSKYYNEIVGQISEKISQKINSHNFLTEISDDLKKNIEKEILNVLPTSDIPEEFEKFFDLPESKLESILGMIERANSENIDKINEETKNYKILKNSSKELEDLSKSKPDDKEIGEVKEKIRQVNVKIDTIQNKIEDLEKEYNSKKVTKMKLIDSKIQLCLGIRKNIQKRDSSNIIIPDVIESLERFSTAIRDKKISILEENLLKGLKMLMRKTEFVEKVEINKDTFEVKLFNKNKDEITKSMLSKGELQIYATALVWALARTSSKPLPFMIDTPLARLDIEHRDNLVESFYPNTSHQTIILSTNSEIDEYFYEKLKPSIARSYLIDYDSDIGKTNISQGYFFGRKHNEI